VLLDRLASTGLEVTKSVVRRPVAEQILDELQAGAFMPLATIARRLSGATPAEAKRAALRIAAEGKALLASRAGKDVLVPCGSEALREQELASLVRALDAALKIAKKASKSDRVLLRQDLTEQLDRFVGSRAPTVKGDRTVDLVDAVLRATRRLVDPRLDLAFVPAVVRAVASESDTESARVAVLEANRVGWIELRPESGLGRLSRDDEALCLPGPQGMILSWIRLLAQENR
jgi:hypothetical protein